MDTNIILNLLELAEKAKDESQQKLIAAQAEVNKWGETIMYLNTQMLNKEWQAYEDRGIHMNGYSPKWTWERKAKYFIEKGKKPLSTREIVEAIILHEPKMVRKRAVGGVSSILSTREKEGVFVKSQNERGEAIYSVKDETSDILEAS